MDLLEDVKRAMEVLSDAKNLVCYKYDADFRNLEGFHVASSGEELAESVDVLLSDPPYNVGHLSELEDTSYIVSRPNDMEDSYDLAKRGISLVVMATGLSQRFSSRHTGEDCSP